MDNQQQAQRQAAAEAFLKSLDQLADCFETEPKPPAAESLAQPERDVNLQADLQAEPEAQFDLGELVNPEDLAAADLEQFFSSDPP